ncbi:MAG TPA: ATP-binding cassette domain-containing protein [Methylocella sp.]|nr:ATP-binding cassette domain-containing protein [Methylocella sp.]
MKASLISFRNISYAYGEGKLRRQVLFNITGEIHAGEIVIVKGPSGSGKTTLLSLLGALRATQEGEITILDRRLDGASQDERLQIRRKIGFVFQLHNLIGALTATQNLLMAIRLHPEIKYSVDTAHSILASVGLEHAFDLRPHQLSGGERQRVAIARALVTCPKIVLADEPTASLDGVTGHTVVTMLRNLANEQGTAVLLVTHDVRVLDVGDRVLAMEDGRLVDSEFKYTQPGTVTLASAS